MTFPRSTPGAEGVDADGLVALIDALDAPDSGYQTLMIARHGRVIAEGAWAPYSLGRPHLLYSVSKSFTATVVGQLVDQGRLALDTPVWSYLRPDWETLEQPWPQVLVRDCLGMTVGHSVDGWGPDMWEAYGQPGDLTSPDPFLATVLAKTPDRAPGSVWAYNQIATYLLAQAVHAVTGRLLTTEVRERLLGPFGVQPLRAQRTPQGRDLGYSGMAVPTEAMLALAQTYLDRGPFAGEPVVSAEWVAAATEPTAVSRPQLAFPDEWSRGYGFSFWAQSRGYRGDGAFGQFAIVLPKQDLTVAITSEHDLGQTLEQLWTHLLPACDRAGSHEADQRLVERLAGLTIPALGGSDGPALAVGWFSADTDVAGLGERVEVRRSLEGHTLALASSELAVGAGQWRESSLSYSSGSVPVMAAGGWSSGTFVAELRLIETPHTIRLAVDGSFRARARWREVPLTGPDPRTLIAAE